MHTNQWLLGFITNDCIISLIKTPPKAAAHHCLMLFLLFWLTVDKGIKVHVVARKQTYQGPLLLGSSHSNPWGQQTVLH